jgi:hypothetical protein
MILQQTVGFKGKGLVQAGGVDWVELKVPRAVGLQSCSTARAILPLFYAGSSPPEFARALLSRCPLFARSTLAW